MKKVMVNGARAWAAAGIIAVLLAPCNGGDFFPIGGGGGGKLSSGGVVVVDAVNGSDSTGTRGRLDKPFLTVAAAKAAASSGDTIRVLPGSYSVNGNLAIDGINWTVEAGASITNTSGTVGIFDDSVNGAAAAVSFVVSGSGRFDGGTMPVVNMRNDSTIIFSAQSATSSGTTFYQNSNNSGTGAGYLDVTCPKIVSTGTVGAAAVWWLAGQFFVHGNDIRGAGPAVVYSQSNAASTTTNFFWVESQKIYNTSSTITNAYKAIWAQSDGSQLGRAWVIAREIRAPVAVDNSGGSLLYVSAQKVFGQVWVESGASKETYVDAQKISDDGLNDSLVKVDGGSLANLNIHSFDDAGITNNVSLVAITGGTTNLSFQRMARTLAGNGIAASAGTINVANGVVSTQGGSTDLVQSSTGTINAIGGATYSTSSGTITNAAAKSSSVTIGAGSAITSSGPGGTLGSNAFNSTSYLSAASNLSDLNSPGTARTNLGAYTYADAPVGQIFTVAVSGINAKTVATTDIFTVPTGKTFCLLSAHVTYSNVTGASTVIPTWTIQDNSGNTAMANQGPTASNIANNHVSIGVPASNAAGVTMATGVIVRYSQVQGSDLTTVSARVTLTGFYF